MTLEVALESTSPSQSLLFRFLADETVDFHEDLKAFFHQSAQRELDSILERLSEFYRRTQYETDQEEDEDHEEPTNDADEEAEDGSNDEVDDDDELDADLKVALETLGLTDAATWREVQATYRRLAKKYHPDAHTSRRPTPQQVKNLEKEFCKAKAAYDRLRDFFHD